MSTVAASPNKERIKLFETVLSSPGMAEKCKVNLHLSRQTILLLARLLEAGLFAENKNYGDEILDVLPSESLQDLRLFHEEILKKSDLTAFYQCLKNL